MGCNKAILGALRLIAAAGCIRGQDIIPAETQAPIKVDVDVVNVLCAVRDRNGALVSDLSRDDFEIREDGRPQEIRYFARETDLPLTIGLLVDVSGSVRQFVRTEKDTAERFLTEIMRPQDRVSLTGFSSTVVPWQDFTASPALLRAALERLHAVPFRGLPKDGGPMPCTLLYDAVQSIAGRFQSITGRKAILVISDGVDIGSRQNIDGAIRAIQSADTIVYGVCYRNPRESGCGRLQGLAEPTGGRMFAVTPATPVSAIFKTIEEELRSQYSLGYVSTNTEHDGAFRKLRVDVLRKGFKVQTRKGYYARAM